MRHPFIIVDVGSNNRGRLELALVHIEKAKEIGGDAVKFQLYTAEELYGVHGHIDYELPRAWLPLLKEHADKVGIEFLCTAFSPQGVAEVDPYVKRHKLASAEMMHFKMWEAIAETGKPFIVSTGGATHYDVTALRKWFWEARVPDIETKLSVLECVALYPSPCSVYDLSLFGTCGSVSRRGEGEGVVEDVWNFRLAQGLSDHTVGNHLALAALGAGATIFEKHFDATADESPTPDSPVSLSVAQMRYYVEHLREAASAFGDGVKMNRHQHDMVKRWRRRLIATQPMQPGVRLSYGVNYGIFRSLKDDPHGWGPSMAYNIEGKMLAVAKEPGDSLFITDVMK